MDDGVSPMIGIIVLVISIILENLASGFVAAIDNVGDSQLEKLTNGNAKKLDRLQRYHDNEVVYLHVWQMLTAVLLLLNGIVQYQIWSDILAIALQLPYILGGIVILAISIFLFVSFGIFVPWYVCQRKAETKVCAYVTVFRVYDLVLRPIMIITEVFSHLIARLFGVDPTADVDDVTEEEIISMVNEGHEQGVLLASEAAMIQNIFEFGDKDAKDIMVHRKNIIGMDGELTLKEAVSFMNANHNSRYPVYLDNLDNIIGIFHIKEALECMEDSSKEQMKIKDIDGLIRTAEFIPETHGINTLFTKMQSEKNHMVIVVDEYGQTSGIISMEDILEEIVGNIQDEHDDEEDTIEKVTEDHFIMEGRTSLEEVSDILGISFEEEEVETLNGYLISQIDKIPSDHESFSVIAKGYEFTVLDVENKMIQNVRVKKTNIPAGDLES